jgi:hypothetical protein
MLQGNALDIGYAQGGLGEMPPTLSWYVIDTDILPRRNAAMSVVSCDLNRDFPFVGSSFRAVLGGQVVEHSCGSVHFLWECVRGLRPRGWLTLATSKLLFFCNCLQILSGKFALSVSASRYHRICTRKSVHRPLRPHGLMVDHDSSSHVLLPRRVDPRGKPFEILGDAFLTIAAHLIMTAKKSGAGMRDAFRLHSTA